MRRTRVRGTPEFKEIVYTSGHWELLRRLRERAREVMEVLHRRGLVVWLHGSIARGDVNEKSDIDIVIPTRVPSYMVELALEDSNIKTYSRYIVAATPTTTPKAVISLDEEERVIVTFPLAEFKPLELEFYKFGGYVTYDELLRDKRVPGVNKNLVLIIPTPQGHIEMPVIGYEDYVAKYLGVSLEIVKERVEVLTRRDKVGRTGVYAKIALAPNENFDEAIERLLKERPLLRRFFER